MLEWEVAANIPLLCPKWEVNGSQFESSFFGGSIGKREEEEVEQRSSQSGRKGIVYVSLPSQARPVSLTLTGQSINQSIGQPARLLSPLLTANHHDDDAIDLFVGRVRRDVAKPHRGEGGEREIQ